MKHEAEEFRSRMKDFSPYSKEEVEFLKKVKNNPEQERMSEKYAFMPTVKEFKKHINETLKGMGISIDNDEENER